MTNCKAATGVTNPKPDPEPEWIHPALKKLMANVRLRDKIQGFGAEEIKQAKAYQKYL